MICALIEAPQKNVHLLMTIILLTIRLLTSRGSAVIGTRFRGHPALNKISLFALNVIKLVINVL